MTVVGPAMTCGSQASQLKPQVRITKMTIAARGRRAFVLAAAGGVDFIILHEPSLLWNVETLPHHQNS
ncbi:hypothetical protein AS189_12905 [Arthrobacter alpinus]|uniref:Uncharacterized protein n=1 Tax=Arthrobacter alpinus TaxID=656366 RepID=A0A0S2M0F9_9MICC|nr:hypothetical protein AS189_12905 [Arthrobacter alpinus]